MKQISLKSQQGASVTSVILIIICLGLLGKLAIAIIPAYVGDYQFNKLVQGELQKANGANQSDKQFIYSLGQQLALNANYNSKPEEMLVFISKAPGSLSVRTNYAEESVFYGGTFVVNRFSAEINNETIKKVPPMTAEEQKQAFASR